VLLSLLAAQNFSPFTAPHGMVVSDSRLASEAGAEAMRRGGNAVDAAVATALVLAVVHPSAGNLGGGGFMLVHIKGKDVALDFREKAPVAASRDMYLAKPQDSTLGYRSVGIPGTPYGLWYAQKTYGKLPWASLVEPARRLAAQGFPLSRGLALSLKGVSDFKRFPASYAQFQRGGKFYAGGERFVQPDLAATLARMKSGIDDFYRGETARRLVAAMKANGGLITMRDLQDYTPTLREPLRAAYQGYQVVTMPPPSSGGIALLQMLGTVEGRLKGPASVDTVHVTVEAMKRAFADRAAFLGDPDYVKVPVDDLLSKARIDQFRSEIGDRATPAESIQPKLDALHEGDHTTHFSIVDAAGNAVSLTYTLNLGFGSKVVAPGTGFLLNNEMDDFASAPGRPNAFGLIQGEANAIAPGKRPLSSMTPTILLKNGKPALVLGSPGGPTIINTVFETILNVTEWKMDVQRAVSAPRYHHQWRPDTISFEPNAFPEDVVEALKSKGHVFAARPSNQGSCHAVMILPDGWRAAGTDPRLPDAGAAGY
jgi:gamma-glutamyltranspeptidase/glutathione hydrolase